MYSFGLPQMSTEVMFHREELTSSQWRESGSVRKNMLHPWASQRFVMYARE
jgi:hypothetical protein